jgi:hypothetical protein
MIFLGLKPSRGNHPTMKILQVFCPTTPSGGVDLRHLERRQCCFIVPHGYSLVHLSDA